MTARPFNPNTAPQSPQTLKIALVDDHELLLGGLAGSLRGKPRIGKVSEYQNPNKLIEDLGTGCKFDLVVSDMLMGDMNGLTLALELKTKFATPVLLMSGVEAPPSAAELARYGITGFVHKSAPIDTLYEAILAVSAGQPFLLFPDGWDSEKPRPKFGRQSGEASGDPEGIALSERQLEVLKLVTAGAANKEIASSLRITENTVKTHMKHIFNALGVTKRTACVQAAKSRGLVE